MAEEKTDLELVRELQQGKDSAYELLVSRYSNKVYSLASRMTRNPEDAEEVLQDVFITVYRKIKNFEGKSSFSSWLYRVAVNASLMKIRKRKQNKSIGMDDALPNDQNSLLLRSKEEDELDNLTLRNEVRDALYHAISKLPEEYRPVFVLRDIDGLTSKEVGKILNLTVPAVKSRLHRSRLMLRKKLAAFYREYSNSSTRLPFEQIGNI